MAKDRNFADDPVRSLIQERAKELGKDFKTLSLRVGRNHSWLQQFMTRSKRRSVPEEQRILLARELEVDSNRLTNIEPRSKEKTPSRYAIPLNARIGGAARLGTTVPVYGHAMGGREGQFVLNGNKVADILAPPTLNGVIDAYAVYIVGTSMEPRYFSGEVVFVHPGLPVRQGDFVVAQIKEDETEGEAPFAYVKQFISRDAKRMKLRQLKPNRILEFPENKVVSVHRIIMGGQG